MASKEAKQGNEEAGPGSTSSGPLLPQALRSRSESHRSHESHQVEEQKTSVRQWLVLFSFCLNTALNSFLSVNFAVVSSKTQKILDKSQSEVQIFYTAFLLTVAVGMFPGLLLVTNCEMIGLASSVFFNVSCCWVRWIGLKERSYAICMVSAVLNAAGAWVILPLPAQLSQQRFPPSWWTLTTSLAIQANYTGWLLGSVLPPAFITEDGDTMERFMLVQAFFSIPVVLGFLLFYRPRNEEERLAGENSRLDLGQSILSEHGEAPFDDIDRQAGVQRARSSSSFISVHGADSSREVGHGGHGGGHSGGSCQQFFRTLKKYPRFGMQIVAYGTLGGVSFAFPGADEAMLEHKGFSDSTTSAANAAFLGVGIVSGLLLGAKVTARDYGKVLKSLFGICAVASIILAILMETVIQDDSTRNLVIVIVLFGFIGMTSLGFIGLGIEAAALYPAGGAYVCFTIEGLVQVIGALLNQFAANESGFTIIAICVAFSAILLFVSYQPYSDVATRSFARRDSSAANSPRRRPQNGNEPGDHAERGCSLPDHTEGDKVKKETEPAPVAAG